MDVAPSSLRFSLWSGSHTLTTFIGSIRYRQILGLQIQRESLALKNRNPVLRKRWRNESDAGMKAGAEGSRRDAETRREMQKHVWHAQRLCDGLVLIGWHAQRLCDGRGGAPTLVPVLNCVKRCLVPIGSNQKLAQASALRLMDRIRPRYKYSSDFK